MGIHRPDQYIHPPAAVIDAGLDELVALVVADGQELAGGAENDDPRHIAGHLPVEEVFPGGKVDMLAVPGEGCDGDGVAATECLGHDQVSRL